MSCSEPTTVIDAIALTGKAHLSLVSAGSATPWIRLGPLNRFTCEIVPDPNHSPAYTNASWVVDLQWVLCTESEDDRYQSFSPAVQADYSTQYIANQSVTNRGYVRLYTSTGEPGADPAALVLWSLK